jgi:hypothetical protein
LYRRMKVDEAVFEALTQQYEMAKVEEAKDTPSVKVLDVATIPEKKSFPPRLLIIFLFTSAAIAAAAMIIVTEARWRDTEPANPRKVFAQEVFRTVNSTMPWAPPNGSRFQRFTNRCWSRLVPTRASTKESKNQ